MAVRVKGISAGLRGFNVERSTQTPANAAVVENRLGDEFYKGSAGKWVYE